MSRDENKHPVQTYYQRMLQKARKIVAQASLEHFECPSCHSTDKIFFKPRERQWISQSCRGRAYLEIGCSQCSIPSLRVDVEEGLKTLDYFHKFSDHVRSIQKDQMEEERRERMEKQIEECRKRGECKCASCVHAKRDLSQSSLPSLCKCPCGSPLTSPVLECTEYRKEASSQ